MNQKPAAPSALAVAHANFALVKYWGKRETALNLPDVGSISLTLDALWSRTRVSFDARLGSDVLVLNGDDKPQGTARVAALLDRFRRLSGTTLHARVDSENNFPTGAGLASSASGFAALVTAADAALGLGLTPEKRSELARIGSGSAARSVFGGFVEMERGRNADGSDSIARPLASAQHWPLAVVIAVSDRGQKAIGSTEGMQRTAQTSPFYRAWVDNQPADLELARVAIARRDFQALAEVSEASALAMHGLAMSARPGLLYFNATTVECLHRVRALRSAGVGVFFTVDAGPQVKAICLPEDRARVAAALADVFGVTEILQSGLGCGAYCLERPAQPEQPAR
ncbi:MAG: diphosphomevalonate decarboxylase [Wenzhouxiangellaceae bacterium]|nr:diphosphomevalonate decarboxylase [Wenzhouxiangellaceae bacterium]